MNPAAPKRRSIPGKGQSYTSASPMSLIGTWYRPGSRVIDILVRHSRCVAEKAVAVARAVPHLDPDLIFIQEAAILHDIGIFLTHSPKLGCYGRHPYICHGYLGRELLERNGYPRHALVCERHVGVGLSAGDITREKLPLPIRDMRPVTIEEQIVCYADKFFSKDSSDPEKEKPLKDIQKMLASYGPRQAAQFESWITLFGDG